MVTVALNLGTGNGDCKKLIADAEATAVRPGAIAIDTTTQAGSAGENSAGMDQLVVNATALAAFQMSCCPGIMRLVSAMTACVEGLTSGGLDISIIASAKKVHSSQPCPS
jgi:hypothetical protein